MLYKTVIVASNVQVALTQKVTINETRVNA